MFIIIIIYEEQPLYCIRKELSGSSQQNLEVGRYAIKLANMNPIDRIHGVYRNN